LLVEDVIAGRKTISDCICKNYSSKVTISTQ
jgi:hypothetical protein